MAKMAQRQALVSIEGIPGNWAARTGGNVTADVTPVWDGGADYPEQLASPSSADNVTVRRPVDDARDLSEIKRLKRVTGKLSTTITEQPTNGDGFPIGEPDVYPGALLVQVNIPEYDASSGDPKMIELVFAVSQYV